ncbi:FAD-binding domain-containing protein, partial [Marasmius fiardii PR-910]
NTRFSFKPAAVSYAKSFRDVSEIVKIAARYGLPVAARSGGHSYIASGIGGKDGTLVIDMENMKGITVDPTTNIATVESGNRLGNVAKGLNDFGKAIPHGTCPYVGVGGHACTQLVTFRSTSAYGGFGFPSRLWGLTLDNIQAVNMVLANGSAIRATEGSNADIFW